MKNLILILLLLILSYSSLYAQLNTFQKGDSISAQKMNENFELLQQQIQGMPATTVNCGTTGTGTGINEAIAQGFTNITISGICRENINFGIVPTDPEASGVLAPKFLRLAGADENSKIVDATNNTEILLRLDDHTFVLENLTLEGGKYGIQAARNASLFLNQVRIQNFTELGITVHDSSHLGVVPGGLIISGSSESLPEYGIRLITGASGWIFDTQISQVKTGIQLYSGSVLSIYAFDIQQVTAGIKISDSIFLKWGESTGTISDTTEVGIGVNQGNLRYASGTLDISSVQSGAALYLENAKAEIHNLNIPNFDGGTETAAIYAVTSELRLNDSTASTATGGASHIISSGMAKMWLDNVTFSGNFEVAVLGLYAGTHAIVQNSELTSNSYLGIDLTGMSSIWLFDTDVSAQGEGVTAEENSFFQIRDGSTITVSDGTGIIAETGSGVYVRSGSNITSTGGPAIDMQQNTWLNIESVEQGETTIINRTDPAGSDIELKGNSSINVGEGNQIDNVSCTSLTSLAGNLSGVSQWKGGCEASTSTGSIQRGQTLELVRKRGLLRCGVSQGLAGFSRQDNLGTWEGLDVDYCRAVAAAIFGDTTKVEYISLTAPERFEALRSGEIDVLSRNSTWTMGRDTSLELEFVGVNYYDGQALMVRSSLGASSALELDGKSACVNTGTSTESNLVDFFAENQLELVSISYNSGEEALAGYLTGDCDIYTTDRSGLAAQRSVFDTPTDHQILPETISKEPLSPVVREDDPQWIELTRWTRHALLTAEELGVNSGNVDSLTNSPQRTIRLLLGTEGDLHEQIGLNSNWAYNIVKQVGNYGEIYERNVGTNSPLMLTRAGSDNALWKDGGLLYAPPIR